MTVTVAKLRAGGWQLLLHGRLAKGGSIYQYRSRDFPRLVVSHSKSSRQAPTEIRYAVDGKVVSSIDEAVAALNRPADEGTTEEATTA